MIDPKIGKRGEYPPTLTLSGNAVKRPPYLIVHQLPDGYYAIGDTFPSVDVLEELTRLADLVNNLSE